MALTAFQQCKAYLQQGPRLDVNAFWSWWLRQKEQGQRDSCFYEGIDEGFPSLLHIAIMYQVPAPAIHIILNAWPEGATKVASTEHGNTPLHFAMLYTAPVDVTLALIRFNKKAVTTLNKKSFSPALFGILYKTHPDVMVAMVAACPGVASMQMGDTGLTPMHFLLRNGVDDIVLMSFLKLNPDSAKEIFIPPVQPATLSTPLPDDRCHAAMAVPSKQDAASDAALSPGATVMLVGMQDGQKEGLICVRCNRVQKKIAMLRIVFFVYILKKGTRENVLHPLATNQAE